MHERHESDGSGAGTTGLGTDHPNLQGKFITKVIEAFYLNLSENVFTSTLLYYLLRTQRPVQIEYGYWFGSLVGLVIEPLANIFEKLVDFSATDRNGNY